MSVVIEQLDDVEVAKIVTRGLRALNARHEDFGDSLSEDIGAACDAWDAVWARLCECDCNGGAIVERCDDCQVFADDIVAAEALAATLEGGHVVMRPVHGDANRLQPAVYPCEGWTE
jgi:hypothetical protein